MLPITRQLNWCGPGSCGEVMMRNSTDFWWVGCLIFWQRRMYFFISKSISAFEQLWLPGYWKHSWVSHLLNCAQEPVTKVCRYLICKCLGVKWETWQWKPFVYVLYFSSLYSTKILDSLHLTWQENCHNWNGVSLFYIYLYLFQGLKMLFEGKSSRRIAGILKGKNSIWKSH